MAEELVNEVGFESGDTDFIDGKTLVDDTTAQGEPDKPETGKADDGKKPDAADVPPVGVKGDTPAAPVKEGEKEDEVRGFARRFLKAGENGQSTFDAESALAFLKPEAGAPSRYELKPRKVEEKAVEKKDEGKPVEPVNPFKQRIEERKTWRTQRENEAYLWKNTYSEAINAGYDARTALRIADERVRDYIEEKQAEWEYENEAKNAEKKYQEELSAKQQAEARAARIANEGQYVQKLGGYEAYNEFLFGKSLPGGKFEPGYATDFVGRLYDMMNPDEKEVTPEKMEAWWDRFASDKNNLRVVFDVALARLQQEIFPHLMRRAVEVHKETERQKEMSATRRPGGTAHPLVAEREDYAGDLAGFLRPPNSNEVVDTI